MIQRERLKEIKKELSENYSKFELLGKGKRGVVYKISSDLVVKIERDEIETFNTLRNAYDILLKLEDYDYFPKPVRYEEKLRYLIRTFVPGKSISEVKLTLDLIKECLRMCRVLDLEGVNQEELTNPYKHVYVEGDKVMMIDFERTRMTKNPHNVNQFIQYLIKKFNIKEDKRGELIKLSKKYKKTYNRKVFDELISFSYV